MSSKTKSLKTTKTASKTSSSGAPTRAAAAAEEQSNSSKTASRSSSPEAPTRAAAAAEEQSKSPRSSSSGTTAIVASKSLRRVKKNKFNNCINEYANKIAILVNKHQLFKEGYTFEYENLHDGTLNVKFYINETTPPSAAAEPMITKHYSLFSYHEKNGKKHAHGIWVGSELGDRTGMFLFYMNLLVVILCGVQDFKLDNNTDYPERAEKGIYKLLEMDRRDGNIYSGPMRLKPSGDLLKLWSDDIKVMINDETPHKIWADGISAKLKSFVEEINKIFPQRGGGKKKSKRKKIYTLGIMVRKTQRNSRISHRRRRKHGSHPSRKRACKAIRKYCKVTLCHNKKFINSKYRRYACGFSRKICKHTTCDTHNVKKK